MKQNPIRHTLFWLFIVLCGLFIPTHTSHAAFYGAHTFADSSVLASGKWIKIALSETENGIYQIPYSQLRKMGFSHPEKVGVYGFGGNPLEESFSQGHIDDLPEVAIFHDTTRQRILFYGRGLISWSFKNTSEEFVHRQHPYATRAYYFLHETDNRSRAMDTLRNAIGEETMSVDTYNAYTLHESDNINLGRTGREWYGESFLYNQSQKFSLSLPERSNDSLLVAINFAAHSTTGSTFSAQINGVSAGSAPLATAGNSYVNGTASSIQRLLNSCTGDDLTIQVTFTPGKSSPNRALLNYIRCQAQCRISLADRSHILFRHSQAIGKRLRYHISEQASENLQVWDVSSPVDVFIQETTDGTFTAPQSGLREYALVDLTSDNFPGIISVGEIQNQNLHALPQVDMLIIVPSAMRSVAEKLAAYRRSNDSLDVAVVTPEQIYNEFSSGTPDATAYRLLCKMFFDRNLADPSLKPLRYLLLFGDTHYDNRSISTSPNYLLCYESEASLVETSSCVCDDYFGFLDDSDGGKTDTDGRLSIRYESVDIGVGRIPVKNLTEAEAVWQKILAYSENRYYGNWKNRFTFLGDDDKEGDAENSHMSHCDSMVHILQRAGHDEFLYKKIYLDAYTMQNSASGTDYPDARKEFMESLQQGTLLVNYAGHGSTTAITHENMIATASASSLRMKQLPIWITATCDFSRYDDDETSCGETLLLNPHGGAAALITTSRVVYASQNLSINAYLMRNLLNRFDDGSRYRLGDIMRSAKCSMGSDFNKLNFCLLGDPSMMISYPEHKMELTSINDTPIRPGTTITLPALSRVTMKGRVLTIDGNQTDTTFNGLIYPTLFDAEETVTTLQNNAWTENPFSFQTRTKKVFNGRDVIRRGEFEFSFIVPQDISYSSGKGLVNLYACSEEGAEGNGAFSNIILSGTSTEIASDQTGPSICTLFLNSPTFKEGDIVNTTPYFYAEVADSSGFNMTGNSIGHDFTLTIRHLNNPYALPIQYSLNNYFTSYTGSPTIGNIRFSIPELAEGKYEATFRAWDVYNNSVSRTFSFSVASRKAIQSVWVQAYPSPAQEGENITFRIMHDRPESEIALRIQVFTETGIKVWEATSTESSAEVAYLAESGRPYDHDNALNADETTNFLGTSSIVWNAKGLGGATIAPGLYIYRVYLNSGGNLTTSESKKLLIIGGNKSR